MHVFMYPIEVVEYAFLSSARWISETNGMLVYVLVLGNTYSKAPKCIITCTYQIRNSVIAMYQYISKQ